MYLCSFPCRWTSPRDQVRRYLAECILVGFEGIAITGLTNPPDEIVPMLPFEQCDTKPTSCRKKTVTNLV